MNRMIDFDRIHRMVRMKLEKMDGILRMKMLGILRITDEIARPEVASTG
jgi:hypothetical protein